MKCLNLALNNSAPEGEWNAAAIRFCAILRSKGMTIESTFGPRPKKSRKPKAKPSPPAGTMPFGKFKGHPLADLPDWYIDWLLEQDFVTEPLRADIEKEAETREEAEF